MSKERLTIEQLRAEQCYIELTQKQKKLVETFISSNGDRVASVMSAYATKSRENAQILAYQFFTSPRVVACLAAYFQDDPLESFKAEVRRAYRNKKITVAQVRAMTLHAELNGWGSASLPSLHGRDSAEPVAESESPRPVAPQDGPVPPGCRPVRSKKTGGLIGYITPDGERVALNIVEVAQ